LKSSVHTMKKIFFGLFGVGILGVIALQIFMDPASKQSNPEIVAKNFVHYLETDQINKANELSSATLRNNPEWLSMMRQFNANIEPTGVNFKTLSENANTAKVQFYSNPPIILNLQKEGGKWIVMSPSNQ
jgi:hypothetical protein